MVLDRRLNQIAHRTFSQLPEFLQPGDVLVLNDSKVFPARWRGRKLPAGGDMEILLLEEVSSLDWWAMLRPGRKFPAGARMQFFDRDGNLSEVSATVMDINADGHRLLRFEGTDSVLAMAGRLGQMPLPPYIRRDSPLAEDDVRYQTVFARLEGSVAAPTAGLHFTPALLETLQSKGVVVTHVTLHVGHGTFAPIKVSRLEDHRMHEERFSLPAATVDAIRKARSEGRRIVGVGTTTVRVLESVARREFQAGDETSGHCGKSGDAAQDLIPVSDGRTRIFIRPPSVFRTVDAMITNFHLPRSTLLMLVSAFAAPGEPHVGRTRTLQAYREAIRLGYRFYSYGDAMLIQ